MIVELLFCGTIGVCSVWIRLLMKTSHIFLLQVETLPTEEQFSHDYLVSICLLSVKDII